jgi:hypothetical protein
MTASSEVLEKLLEEGWSVVGYSAQSEHLKDHHFILIQKGTALRSIRFTDETETSFALGEGRHMRETILTEGILTKDS